MPLKHLPQAERYLNGKLSLPLDETSNEATVDTPPSADKIPTYFEFEPRTDNVELTRVIGVNGSVITLERGLNTGGVGKPHLSSSIYEQKFTSRHYQAIAEALENGCILVDPTYALAKVDTDTFTITGNDETAYFTAGRYILINGSIVSRVVSSSYSTGVTTVNIADTTVPDTITSVGLEIAMKSKTVNMTGWVDDVDAANITFDISAGPKHRVTMAGNRNLLVSNAKIGDVFLLRLKQDATGSRVPVWFSGISWVDGTAPTLTTTANKADTFGFIVTGSGAYDGFVVGQNL